MGLFIFILLTLLVFSILFGLAVWLLTAICQFVSNVNEIWRETRAP